MFADYLKKLKKSGFPLILLPRRGEAPLCAAYCACGSGTVSTNSAPPERGSYTYQADRSDIRKFPLILPPPGRGSLPLLKAMRGGGCKGQNLQPLRIIATKARSRLRSISRTLMQRGINARDENPSFQRFRWGCRSRGAAGRDRSRSWRPVLGGWGCLGCGWVCLGCGRAWLL
jgi:hypothetical protein